MKKSIMLLIAIMIICSVCLSTLAEHVDNSDSIQSQFLQAWNQKGVLLVDEISDGAQIGDIRYAKDTITEVTTGRKYNAILFEADYYNSMVDHGMANNVVDVDEIDNVISTLEYIKANMSNLNYGAEIKYIAKSGLCIGAFQNGSEDGIYIELASGVKIILDMNEIDNLIMGINRIKRLFDD